MSIRRCIPGLLAGNQLSRDQAERMGGLFDDLERDYSSKFGKQAAEAMASEETVKRFAAEAALKKRQAALQIKAQQQIAADVRKFRGDKPGASAEALLASDDRAPYFNVEFRSKAIANQHLALMNGILEKHSRNFAGQVRNYAELLEFVKERFGESTGSQSAQELSDAFGETAESLRTLFNLNGGAIGKLDNWGLPQVHNMLAVRSVPFEQWRDFIRPLLDPQKMLAASGNPMTPGQLELALKSAYETIASDGWNDRSIGAFAGSKMANRHGDSRFLIFKDADSWLAYTEKFGRPLSKISEKFDPGAAIFDAMLGHIHSMSNDIALMERLGPNPAATIRWITDGLKYEAHQTKHAGTKRMDLAESSAVRIENMYAELTGGFKVEKKGLAKKAAALRTLESAAKLGSAVLSSTSDVATQFVTRRFNGLPAAKVLTDYIGTLRPSSAADRAHAYRQLHINERAIRTMGAFNRMTNETVSGEIPARLSDAVMHNSYLSKWTDDGRKLYNEQTWASITDRAGMNWQTLGKKHPRFQKMFERYGLGEGDWETIRSTPLEESNGGQWILPGNISDPTLSQRLAEMILQESEYSTITSSLRMRAAVNANLRKGSIPGEFGRSALLFRGFPMQMFWMHGRRMLQQGGVNALRYGATLYVATTMMGALSLQLKQVVNGKDPLDMTDPTFWLKASVQGGGFGIFGDFLNSAVSRSGQDFWTTVAGPVAGTIDDFRHFFSFAKKSGHLQVFTSHPGRALRQLIQNNLPGSTLWYTRLAFQREILDQMQAEIDPQYWDSFSRMEKRAKQDGTQFYWRPGHRAPDRAPDAHKAAGN